MHGKAQFTERGIEKVYGDRFVGGNSVELLVDRDAFSRIFDTISRAKDIVSLEFYIFRNDETGAELSGLLKEKAREGIRIYILYDHLGSFGTPSAFWRGLKEAGINVRASHPFRWAAPGGYQHRDHRKLIIVDGDTAFTGGLNIANEYRGIHLKRREPWRDTTIMLRGPAAAVLFGTFRKAWDTWGGGLINYEPHPVEHGSLPAIPIFAHSAKGRRRMRRLIYYSINHARSEINLTTAYFTPSRRMVETLEEAVKHGVRVRLLLPGISDVPAARYTGRAFFGRLLGAGVEIYNYSGQVLHAKSYVFDRSWSIVGSANLDFQSLRWNDEGNVGILDEGFAADMTAMFEKDIANSARIDPAVWSKRPFMEKVKERFFSLLRRRL